MAQEGLFLLDVTMPPQLFARNRHGHLVQMPARSRSRASATKFTSEQRAELQDPTSQCLIRYVQPSLRQKIFDVAITKGEAEIEPNGMPNDLRRESVARKRNCHAASYPPPWAPSQCRL